MAGGGLRGATALSLPFLEWVGPAVEGGGALCDGTCTCGRMVVGADTRCNRSRIDAWISAMPWQG